MRCTINHSLYEFINGRVGNVDVDLNNGLLEVLVDQGRGPERFVVAKHEVTIHPDLRTGVPANEIPY